MSKLRGNTGTGLRDADTAKSGSASMFQKGNFWFGRDSPLVVNELACQIQSEPHSFNRLEGKQRTKPNNNKNVSFTYTPSTSSQTIV